MDIKQPTLGLAPTLHPLPQGRYSPPYRPPDSRTFRCMSASSGNFFSGLDDGLLARAEAMGVVDMGKPGGGHQLMKPEGLYGHTPDFTVSHGGPPRGQMPPMHHHHHPSFGPPTDSMFEPLTPSNPPGMPLGPVASMAEPHPHHPNVSVSSASHGHAPHSPVHHQMYANMYSAAHPAAVNPHTGLPPHHPHPHHPGVHDGDCDPRELEMFAERFKQRRIKLGVTQADVGSALANLKIPGVGCLSQSTICRFESLTLSHNNMIALKPILMAWLEEAERQARERKAEIGADGEKKRKRTSIAAPEKRSLEAYFAVQPRPSGEKIAQIAEKLELKKNVVRVWFCNQRQKQKRMKFSASSMGHH
ncbi:POU domain, class 4, transcription factor 3-like [Littorina saxatilis]|uniref:POU domain, class 4, transcription factor 3-like n=1 Tax=Littorina saxatilis TaxID=31220 RepID=UPI0038B42D7B